MMYRTAQPPTFIPTTLEEVRDLGWDSLDVVLITGDTYIDSAHIGAAVIGRVLLNAGYRVGIIAQPDVHSPRDISRLGEPTLFWGVSAGSMDSMVANYTAAGKPRRKRRHDPGRAEHQAAGTALSLFTAISSVQVSRKPGRLCWEGLKRALGEYRIMTLGRTRCDDPFSLTPRPTYWSSGWPNAAFLSWPKNSSAGRTFKGSGGCVTSAGRFPKPFPNSRVRISSCRTTTVFVAIKNSSYGCLKRFMRTRIHLRRNDSIKGKIPATWCKIHLNSRRRRKSSIVFTNCRLAGNCILFIAKEGRVAALETIQFSLTTHRGCYGECRFCALTVHQGRQVVSRSEASILREAAAVPAHPDFKGIISDVGGPTANMYGSVCRTKRGSGYVPRQELPLSKAVRASDRSIMADRSDCCGGLRQLAGIRKVYVGSGIRYDMILETTVPPACRYLQELINHHVSGQLKIAPEHAVNSHP
jgi:hypothetical protein